MGKTRDLFKKIRDTKGTFHAKTGTIKDRNGMDVAEAEDIKNRWQEYTEELYKKDLHDPDNHNGVITHLEPDILKCKVKWALASITTKKASGGDGISVELFQILKDDAVKVLHSICQQIWKTQQWPQDWKSFHSNPKERQCQRMLKLPHNCTHMDRGAWRTAVHGVAKSRTQLSDFTFTFHFQALGEGNGNPLQCSCLENPRDRGAWWAAVYGVAQGRTGLK